ncbi:MAG: hypothetical protein OEN02_04435 [Gammaproteobacteria bacterium]|nr:hypothetical protein [Gammaproteobacteria bacterium]MDH3535245.1 hypothetical protein [Gammaproteobacteria bacterium]
MVEFKEIISVAGYGIVSIGVSIIIVGTVTSSLRFLNCLRNEPEDYAYGVYRRQPGRCIILGLDF